MLELALLWLGLLAALIFFGLPQSQGGGALVLSYFLGLSLIHVPGVLPYIAATYLPGADLTLKGFQLTVLGMALFVVGALIARRTTRRRPPMVAPPPPEVIERFGTRALIGGVFSYFVLIPVAARVPSLTSLVSPFGTLLVIGLWLRLYGAAMRGELARTAQTLTLLPLLPLATLGTAGFIGYGVNWVLSIVSFFFSIARNRIWFFLAAPAVVFLGLSFFVAYMGVRTGIRDVVWNESAGVEQRLERIGSIFTHFSPLDLSNPEHIAALDDRLNQNLLVGEGMDRHEQGLSPYLYGGSVPLWSFVPRALWPNKPAVGGGGEIVSAFTGQDYAADTSVGAGQVLEFYMNFGYAGVVVGFALLGYTLMRLDLAIVEALRIGDLKGLLRCAMPGLALLQPGGNLIEIMVVVVASIAGAYVITSFKVFGVPTPAKPGYVVV